MDTCKTMGGNRGSMDGEGREIAKVIGIFISQVIIIRND